VGSAKPYPGFNPDRLHRRADETERSRERGGNGAYRRIRRWREAAMRRPMALA